MSGPRKSCGRPSSRLWTGVVGLIFLTAFWLGTAWSGSQVGLSNWSRDGWTTLSVDRGSVCWSSSRSYVPRILTVSNPEGRGWDWGVRRHEFVLDLWPLETKTYRLAEEKSGGMVIREGAFPLWPLPLGWAIFWPIWMVRRQRAEKAVFER